MQFHRLVSASFLLCRLALATPTNSNDVLSLSGSLQNLSTTIVNPYSGQSLAINGQYFVNNASYDGLGGLDVLLMTNASDFLVLDDNGVQRLISVEVYSGGDGNDVIHLASSMFVLGDIFATGGQQDDIIWANAGNDMLAGGGGNDILDGGPGDDVIEGEDGNDLIWGGLGMDVVGLYGPLGHWQVLRVGPSRFIARNLIDGSVDEWFDVEKARFFDFGMPDQEVDLLSLPITSAVPEPSTGILSAAALTALAVVSRRRATR